MADTPERIWAVNFRSTITAGVYTTDPGDGVEYVRADIHAALLSETERLRTERDEARERLEALVVPGHGSTSPDWERGFRDGFLVAKQQALAALRSPQDPA